MLAEGWSLFYAILCGKVAGKLTKMERKGEKMENLFERKWFRRNEQRWFND